MAFLEVVWAVGKISSPPSGRGGGEGAKLKEPFALQ